MKNICKIVAWVSSSIGVIMMLLGIIAVISGGIFLNHRWSNYFYPAYNFLLLGILSLLFVIADKGEK